RQNIAHKKGFGARRSATQRPLLDKVRLADCTVLLAGLKSPHSPGLVGAPSSFRMGSPECRQNCRLAMGVVHERGSFVAEPADGSHSIPGVSRRRLCPFPLRYWLAARRCVSTGKRNTQEGTQRPGRKESQEYGTCRHRGPDRSAKAKAHR